MRYLIVNADDFGYSFGVNKGIIKAHTEGIVTSTSVMVDAIGAEAAELKQFPLLSVGLHFAVSDFDNVQAEFDRQLQRFVSIVGNGPDHIDTHKLSASSAGFQSVLQQHAQQYGIPIRGHGPAKFIDSFFGMHSGGDVSVERLKAAIDQATDAYNEIMCHVGYADDYLRAHSSYSDMRENELGTICSPATKQYISEQGLELCNWKAIEV